MAEMIIMIIRNNFMKEVKGQINIISESEVFIKNNFFKIFKKEVRL